MPDEFDKRSGNARRLTDWFPSIDVAGTLAVLYTVGYLVMVGLLYFVEIPPPNKEPLLQLFGLMSAIQMALIAFYFGSSKNAEVTQERVAQSKERTDAAMRDIVTAAVPPSVKDPMYSAPAKDKE